MKFQTGLLVLGLFLSQANAAEIRDFTALNSQLENANKQASDWEAAIKTRRERIAVLQGNLQAANANFAAADNKYKPIECTEGLMWGMNCSKGEKIPVPQSIVDAKKKAEDEAKEIATLEAEIARGEEAIPAWRKQANEANRNIGNLTADQQRQQNTFNYLLNNLGMTMNTVKLDLLDTNRMLDDIRNKYDQTVLGIYLRDKMGQLLGSKSFCDAARSCGGTRDAAAIQKAVTAELFPGQRIDSRKSSAPAARPVAPGGAK